VFSSASSSVLMVHLPRAGGGSLCPTAIDPQPPSGCSWGLPPMRPGLCRILNMDLGEGLTGLCRTNRLKRSIYSANKRVTDGARTRDLLS
jgi:hypothetical protein